MVSVEDKVLQLEFLICYIKVAILRGLKGKHTHTLAHAHTCTHTLQKAEPVRKEGEFLTRVS